MLWPLTNEVHLGIENNPLTDDLANFSVIADELQSCYMKEFLVNIKDGGNVKQYSSQECKIVYVTQKEKQEMEAVENLPIAQITKRIFQNFEKLGVEEGSLYEELFNKTIKGKKKSAYVEFLTELEEQIDVTENRNSDSLADKYLLNFLVSH